ncbi:MAG: hypothetical protein NT062_33120 [Proteobacteria bacterium]|nr:hypothetical protein [Pseudomonadota bacterium]
MLLDERIRADGVSVSTFATRVGDRIRLIETPGETLGELSAVAIDRVMVRYARALESPAALLDDRLDLGDGRALRRMRFHAIVDAEARDYLVYERPGEEPIAVIATMATAALRHLATKLRSSDS